MYYFIGDYQNNIAKHTLDQAKIFILNKNVRFKTRKGICWT